MGSVDELKYCQTDKPEFLPLDLDLISRDYLTFIITEVQPTYFVAESFEKAKM
jgi:phenylalanine-4-hydroxylase